MADGNDTPLPGGAGEVLLVDGADNWPFAEEDEGAAPQAAAEGGQPEEAAAAAETEAAEAETEAAEADADAKAEEVPPGDLIDLPDGRQVPREEVVGAYLRQADHARQAAEVAKAREVLAARMAETEGILAAFIDHLAGLVPPPPDTALSLTDPAAYVRQKAQHEAAIKQVEQLVEMGRKHRAIRDETEDSDRRERVQREFALLAERFPEVKTDAGHRKFFEGAFAAGVEIGFSAEELQGIHDHRLFVALDLVREGLAARKARAQAQEKVAKAPPMPMQKPANAGTKAAEEAARERFNRDPTVRSALAVDFDF